MPPRLAAVLLLALALPWSAPTMLRAGEAPAIVDANVATEESPPAASSVVDDPPRPPTGERGAFAALLAALFVAVNLASAPPPR